MELALAALPGVVTSCLLAWLLLKVLERQSEERQAHRIEIDGLNTGHRKEVADLLQRIQAPMAAVADHSIAQNAVPDPPPIDLEDDMALLDQRERDLEQLARELEGSM